MDTKPPIKIDGYDKVFMQMDAADTNACKGRKGSLTVTRNIRAGCRKIIFLIIVGFRKVGCADVLPVLSQVLLY